MNLTSDRPNKANESPGGSLYRELPTMGQVARWRAEQTPDEIAYTFLLDGEQQTASLTYAQLDRNARAIAAEIAQQGPIGQRVLVVLEPGLDYIASLFGCFYAGAIAVPVYPPDPFRLARTLPRLQAISQNSACQAMLSSESLLGGERSALRQICDTPIAIESVDPHGADRWSPSKQSEADLCLLQYTSGTTGSPRGVAISHANLQYNMRAMEQLLDVPDAVVMHWLPPYHDLGLIGGVFLPLFAGRRVVLMSPLDFMRSPVRWLRAISDYRATTSASPNFGYEVCLRKIAESDCEGLDLSSWQIAASGAEPVRSETLDRFTEKFAPYGFRREAFVPAYGMAETTLMVSIGQVGQLPVEGDFDSQALAESKVEPATNQQQSSRRLVGCGPPGPEVDLRIVDPELLEEVAGVGEVWVRCPGVAQGYWQDAASTAASFDAVLSSGESGFLRTGDLGFMDQGELFLVGRRKEMLILGGRNYYPQDIELAIQARDPALKTDGGAVTSVEVDSQERLVVFQEVQRPKRQNLDALLQLVVETVVEETLQEPHAVILLPVGEVPKTSSGKTRRADCWSEYQAGVLTPLKVWQAGSHPAASPSDPTAATLPPCTDTEQWLAHCWQQVLGVSGVGRSDSFIALGGESLELIEMLQQVATHRGVMPGIQDLFQHPTLQQFADWIDQQQPTQIAALPRASESFLADSQPLSDPQQRMWMLEQLGLRGGANVPLALKLDAPLNEDKLRDALKPLAARHQALRTRFHFDGNEPRQQLVEEVELPVERWQVADQTHDPVAWCLDQPFVWQPFDLEQAPLARVALFDAADGTQVLLLVVHHLVCDGASLETLIDDLAGLYNDQALPDLSADYWDYLAQQTQPPIASALEHWQQRLAEVPATLNLPLSTGTPASEPLGIAVQQVQLNGSLVQAVQRLAAELGVTPFVVYLAAYQWLLGRYSGDQQVVVGAAMAGRERAEFSHTVGCFIDALPLAGNADPAGTIAKQLRQLRDQVLADMQQRGLAWDELLKATGAERVAGRMPLAQAFLLYENSPPAGVALGQAQVTQAATDYRGLGVYDLTLVVDAQAHEGTLRLVHDPARLPGELVQAFAAGLVGLLTQITVNPHHQAAQLAACSDQALSDLQQLASGRLLNDPVEHTLAALDRQVRNHPTAVAVECGSDRLTYAELATRSHQVAQGLLAAGIQPGDRVGLMVGRSVDKLAAMLGCWRAGAAYVPMDPAYPAARLEHMAQDCQPSAVIAEPSLVDRVPQGAWSVLRLDSLIATAAQPDATLPPASIQAAAYLIYTSGSTGKPKGVAVGHAALGNFLRSFASDLSVTSEDRILAATTISFDISGLELFLPLTVGATVVMADSAAACDGAALGKMMAAANLSLIQGTPSTYRMWLSTGWRPAASQRLLVGGEALTLDLANDLLATQASVWNVYGPTETTIWSTIDQLSPGQTNISIGRPIDSTTCYVLDHRQRLTPRGAWGELAIGGAGLAVGYHQRPELNAARFPTVQLPGGSERVYLTGDRVRWRADGKLEFGGRIDNQVKVRGHRIELGEIEQALSSHLSLNEVAVVTFQDAHGAMLAAYYRPHQGAEVTPAELRSHLSKTLPEYMIPAAFVPVENALPRTGSGKIDRARLPRPEGQRLARSTERVAPRSPLEERLADWWSEVLRLESPGVTDNFFELGGHSLSMMQIVVRVRDNLGVELPLREAYAQATIGQWAEMILSAQLAAGETFDAELLQQLESMTDEQAIALLEGMEND